MTNEIIETKEQKSEIKSVIAAMADKYEMEKPAFEAVIKQTVMPSKSTVKNEELVAFLSVAKEYDLNPLTKEIYAFPSKSGGITPIVSIDGWNKIINQHPQFDGTVFKDILENGKLIAIECSIYRKDRNHPTVITEYLSECSRNTEPWNKWPTRMLRHKALIQAARYAFSFSGIYDKDEAERIDEVKDVTPSKTANAHGEPPKVINEQFEEPKQIDIEEVISEEELINDNN